jgi:endopolyphosphatase
MHHLRQGLLLLVILEGLRETLCAPAQLPLNVSGVVQGTYTLHTTDDSVNRSCARPDARPRKLTGRFLHITDMHPDPYYREGTSEKSACHRRKPKKKPRSETFGYTYGCVVRVPCVQSRAKSIHGSECDSPLVLTNYTFDYLEKQWADEIDFVVCT